MKDLIKELENLKKGMSVDAYNDAVDDCIDILQSYPVIRCKALRKRGTRKYYYYNPEQDEYCPDKIPFPFTGDFDDAKDMDDYFPDDAELIDLTIIVEEGGEG